VAVVRNLSVTITRGACSEPFSNLRGTAARACCAPPWDENQKLVS
jgi:hypothetical protein